LPLQIHHKGEGWSDNCGKKRRNGFDIPCNVIFVPRGTQMIDDAPDKETGQKWANKYAFVGVGNAAAE